MSARPVTSIRTSLKVALLCSVYHVCARPSASTSTAADLPQSSVALEQLNCQAAQVYNRPNASTSTSLQAIEETDDALNFSSKTWSLTADIGEANSISDASLSSSGNSSSSASSQFIQKNLFLDTSATLNSSSPAPFSACAFVFSLPHQYSNVHDRGDCSDILGDSCLPDLLAKLRTQTFQYASLHPLQPAQELCTSISQAITTNPPSSCNKYIDKKTHNLLNASNIQSSFLDFSQQTDYSSCPSPPLPASADNSTNPHTGGPSARGPLNFYTQTLMLPSTSSSSSTDNNDNITSNILSTQSSMIDAVFLAYFSNSTVWNGTTFGDVSSTCISPRGTDKGNETAPASEAEAYAADTSGAVESVVGWCGGSMGITGWSLGVVGVVFFLL